MSTPTMKKTYRNCGYLATDVTGAFVGRLQAVGVNVPLEFETIDERVSSDHPTHTAYIIDGSGQRMEAGAAWEGTKDKGDRMQRYLSIKFDLEGLPEWAYGSLAAFETRDGGNWRMTREAMVPA
jgi:uncharacterized protein (DUF736 family)